jgi:hypothetical protein
MNPAVLLWFVHFITWHVGARTFQYLDENKLFQNYKFTNTDTLTYYDILPICIRNQICILLPVLLSLDHLQLLFIIPCPSWYEFFSAFITCSVIFGIIHDVLFYIGHRFLHTPWGFRILDHKTHHATKASIAASAIYMSPPDFIVEVVIPFIGLGFFIHSFYMEVLIILIVLGGWGSMIEHSGYNFFPNIKFLDCRPHANHHLHLHQSFSEGLGSPGIMDQIFHTSSHE